jgi:hypothetical protein
VAAVIGANIADIDYGNFKDRVQEEWRHSLYLDLWLRCVAVQEARAPRRYAAALPARSYGDWLPAITPPFDAYPEGDLPYDPGWGEVGQPLADFLGGKPLRKLQGKGKRAKLPRKGA